MRVARMLLLRNAGTMIPDYASAPSGCRLPCQQNEIAGTSPATTTPGVPTGLGRALDILFALFGDQPGRAHREHQKQQREHHDVDHSRSEILGREAFDQPDDEAECRLRVVPG